MRMVPYMPLSTTIAIDRQVVLHGGRELLPGHHEVAVAAERDHRALRISRFIATADGRP